MWRGRTIGSGVIALIALLSFVATPVAAAEIVVTPEPPRLLESPLLITSYQIDNGLPSYIQIHNTTSDLVSLDGWMVNATLAIGGQPVVLPIALDGYIKAESWLVLGQAGLVGGADAEFLLPGNIASTAVERLAVEHPGYATDARAMPLLPSIRYDLDTTSAGNYTATMKYQSVDTLTPLIGGGLYEPPVSTPLRVVAIAANAPDCGPLDGRDECREFVKIQNLAVEPIDLAEYRLRVGHGNDAASINNAFPMTGLLGAGEFFSVAARSDGVPLSLTASGGHAWIEDSYGLTSYAESVVKYQDIGGQDHEGQAWAYDSTTKTWRWALATLTGGNDFTIPKKVVLPPVSTLKPCEANQYRSSETNRCRLLTTVSSNLTPCRTGQYRSQETNRCRSLTAATSSLKPCKANQYRSSETNRCRSLANSTTTLKPCQPGQQRNPATNRCRKVSSPLTQTAFAVEPIKAGAKEFVGWWALGGLTLVGAGYAAWEWRRELRQVITRVAGTGTSN